MAKNRIFVTGIAGFLGSFLAEELLEMGYEVVGNDNLVGGYKDNVPRGAKFYKVDCCDTKKMAKIMKDCEVVYHCAALAYEGLSVFSPALIAENIYQATASTISAAIQNGVKRFIFMSSMARYGKNKVPFEEIYLPRPQDPYGISKYASELLLMNLAETHAMEYVIAVPHNIIGPRQKYDDPYRNVASIMVNRMLQREQPIIYGSGKQKRCFSFINDVLTCLITLMEARVSGEIINIGPDEEFITIYELADKIAKQIGFDLKPIYVPDRPREVRLATCSSDKARKLLGYKTKYTIDEGLEEMIYYIKTRGTKKFNYHLPLEIQSKICPRTWTKHLI
jgi:UDP-glucose 4-epimerase